MEPPAVLVAPACPATMERVTRVFAALGAAALPLLAFHSTVLAQPSVPATFYGSVTIDGAPAPTGTDVRGFVGGVDCTQSAPGERPAVREGEATAYVIAVVHESQRPGCGRPGATVTFTIDGEPADQEGQWQPGPVHVDLSIGPGDPIPLPTATATVPGPPATSTSLTSEPSPIPGTPPTDDVTLPGTTPGPTHQETPGDDGIVSAAGTDDDDAGGSSLFPVLVAVLGLIAVGGAAAGFILSRPRS